jgi:TRAP-type C4-dicarboxylate transport system substrate-binding protein
MPSAKTEGANNQKPRETKPMTMTRRDFVAASAATITTSFLTPAAQAATALNLSSILPDGNFMVENAKKYAEAVSKATGGEIAISVKAGGSLGFKGPEQLRAVRDGLVPMADVLASQQVGDEPLLGTEGIPFLVGSQSDLKALHKVLRPEFEKIAEKFNQKILYMVPSPSQYMFLKVKTDTADGLRGVKIRGADKNTVDICNATGMAGVIIPWGELIPALASGRVEGVATSATSGVDGKFWEFLKFIYPTNHTWSCNLVNINLDAWKKLSPAHQKTMTDLATELEPSFWAVSAQGDKDSIAKMTAQGMEVVTLPPAMMADIRKRNVELHDAFLTRVPAAAPIVKAYLTSVGRG